MGFFSRIRKGKLFYGSKDVPSKVVIFLFGGRKYIVESFDLFFSQDLNSKNRPESEVYGGKIIVTLNESPDDQINMWLMETHRKKDGEFRFLANSNKIVESAQLHIYFKDAYCVGYSKKLNTVGEGVLTTLTIYPRIIKVGNEEWERRV